MPFPRTSLPRPTARSWGSGRSRRFLKALWVAATGAALLSPRWMRAEALPPWSVPSDADIRVNPISASPDIIQKGRALYDHRCADCHGKKGRGDGAGGIDLERRPTDLTAAATREQSDGALFWKITEGRRSMPAYGRKLSEEERWEVIHFLRSLSPKTKQSPVAPKSSVKITNQKP